MAKERAYPMWDQKYDEEHYVYGKEPNDFLAEQVGHLPKGRILCLADGEGRNSVFLAEQGYDVTAVDSSTVGIRKAKALAEEKGVNVSFLLRDLAEFDMGHETWDGVVSIFGHLPPPLRKTVHAAVVKGLKPGGVVLLEAYTPDQLKHRTGGPPVAEMMMTEDSVKSEFAGLSFVHCEEKEREVIEGVGHHGMAAVVQLIAKKSE